MTLTKEFSSRLFIDALSVADAGAVAYAYRPYQGAGPKTDISQAETPRVQAINSAALIEDRPTTRRYRAPAEVLLLAACPLKGPIPQLTAWTMTRVVTFAGRAYQQLMAGLVVLLGAIAAGTILLLRLAVTWSGHVARIEKALVVDDITRLRIATSGSTEVSEQSGRVCMLGSAVPRWSFQMS